MVSVFAFDFQYFLLTGNTSSMGEGELAGVR